MRDASTLITYNAMCLFELWSIPEEGSNTGLLAPIRSFKVSMTYMATAEPPSPLTTLSFSLSPTSHPCTGSCVARFGNGTSCEIPLISYWLG